jgi:type I restriction enzyme R subunit
MTTPEERARQQIDRLLTAAGWGVQDFKAADIHAARGVALREFELNAGFGTADYLLFVYESTGIETHFTNGLDPAPRPRNVFAFHRPEKLAEWLSALPRATACSKSLARN